MSYRRLVSGIEPKEQTLAFSVYRHPTQVLDTQNYNPSSKTCAVLSRNVSSFPLFLPASRYVPDLFVPL